jgi:hypothetical protein
VKRLRPATSSGKRRSSLCVDLIFVISPSSTIRSDLLRGRPHALVPWCSTYSTRLRDFVGTYTWDHTASEERWLITVSRRPAVWDLISLSCAAMSPVSSLPTGTIADARRPLHAPGQPEVLSGGRPALPKLYADPDAWARKLHLEFGEFGKVLERPYDRRICRAYLEGGSVPGSIKMKEAANGKRIDPLVPTLERS